jgi:hypothetical protein
VRYLSSLVLLSLLACKGTDPELGPLDGAITEGNNQTVIAGTTNLPDPVAYQMVRLPNGQVALRRVPLWERLVLPKVAHAQGTVVNGSPVPGAVVCAEEVPALVPFARCANTDNNGKATFFFKVDTTKKGQYRSDIRGSLNNQPAVFDTVIANVDAGPVNPILALNWSPMPSPAVLPASSVVDAYGNAIPFRIVTDDTLIVRGDTVGTVAARTVTFGAALVDTVEMRWRGPLQLRGVGSVHLANGYYRVGVENGAPAIFWRIRGLSAAP